MIRVNFIGTDGRYILIDKDSLKKLLSYTTERNSIFIEVKSNDGNETYFVNPDNIAFIRT